MEIACFKNHCDYWILKRNMLEVLISIEANQDFDTLLLQFKRSFELNFLERVTNEQFYKYTGLSEEKIKHLIQLKEDELFEDDYDD